MTQKIVHIHESGHYIDDGTDEDVCFRIHAGVSLSYACIPLRPGKWKRHLLLESGVRFEGSLIAVEDMDATMITEVVWDGVFSRLRLLAINTDGSDIALEGSARVDAPYRQVDIRVDQTNILIGDNTRVRGVPRLEIATDDVEWWHSCKVHRLGGDALFYLESRGLATKNAETLLLNSEILRHLETVPREEREKYCSGIHERLRKTFPVSKR